VAYVHPVEGTDEEELLDHLTRLCGSTLSSFKRPAEIILTSDLPAGATGKIRRAELRRRDQARVVRVSKDTAGHLYPVDVVRLVTVLGVISVHALAVGIGGNSTPAGLTQTFLHVTREVFLFLSAFVLSHSMKGRPRPANSFWRRRFPLVLAPYAVWSAVYLVADGSGSSVGGVLARYARDLIDAGARYHLYFLLLTFQLYLVFPSLYRWLTGRARREKVALAGTFVFQIAFTAAAHYRLPAPAPVREWFTHAGSWLPSYPFYVVAGVVAARHLGAIEAWVRSHTRTVILIVGAGAAVGLGGYLLDTGGLGMDPGRASEVFTPQVTLESVAAVLGQYALGLWLSDRIGPRMRRRLEASSDLSFGIYLAHPLILQGVLAVGLSAVLARLGPGPGAALILLVIVPAVYAAAAGVAWVARMTPLSLALTGRRRPAREGAAAADNVIDLSEVVADPLPAPAPVGISG